MHAKWLICSIVLVSALVLGFLWGTSIPLGIPGEWTWTRIPVAAEQSQELWLGLISGAIASAIYFLVVWVGSRRLEVAGNLEIAGWLAGLMFAGFFYLMSLQEAPAYNFRLTKAPFVLYYPASSGYYTQARSISSLSQFLADYEAQMQQGDVLHIGTHPPGLTLMHYGIIQLSESSPAVQKLLLNSQVHSVVEATQIIQKQNISFTKTDSAALWLATVLTQLFAVATVVPIYLIARWFSSRPMSWYVAALWPTIPALAIFLPKSDAIYPFLSMLFLWSWLYGMSRQWWGLCMFSGLVVCLGLFNSLAMLPIALMGVVIGLVTIFKTATVPETATAASLSFGYKQVSLCIAAATVGFLLPVLTCWMCWDANLLKIWYWNYQNHAGFYEQYPRTYWKWLLWNPFELLVFVGAPLIVMTCSGAIAVWRGGQPEPRLFFSVCFGIWGLLWLSGKNMGEAARLWLLLMPLLLLLISSFLTSASKMENQPPLEDSPLATDSQQPLSNVCLWVLGFQLIVCLLTVTRITGFEMLAL